MSKQCQSCGMPLQTKKAGDCRGTEKDGSGRLMRWMAQKQLPHLERWKSTQS